MNLCGVERHDDLWLFIFSHTATAQGFERVVFERVAAISSSWVVPLSLGGAPVVELKPLREGGDHFCILYRDAPVVQWLCSLRVAATGAPGVIDPADVDACWRIAMSQWWDMSDLIAKWASDPRVPEMLKPPKDDRGHSLQLRPLGLSGRSTLPR
jgi:hypothetical protein